MLSHDFMKQHTASSFDKGDLFLEELGCYVQKEGGGAGRLRDNLVLTSELISCPPMEF